MYAKARNIVVEKCSGGRWLERWFSLASTVSLQHLAAYLPSLVRPYRQAGHFARCLEKLTPDSFFSAVGVCFASSRALLTNFGELRKAEVRRILHPRTL